MAASSSSPIPPPPQRRYDVFLSFSGLDSRKTILSHLRAALKRTGFHAFRDDDNLDRGKSIAPGLLEAIESSAMSIVVFSKNYVVSTWCLDELEKIMDCTKNWQHIVLPVFYDIEPSDIRKQKGSVAEALAQHEDDVPIPNIEKWRVALTQAASLAGLVSKNYWDEASFIEGIVKEVQSKLNPAIPLNVASHPIGIWARRKELLELLHLESSNGVRVIAIWGIGGLGKTTIAKAAYNYICHQFEGKSFVANVRETWEQSKGDLLILQKQIIYDILGNESNDNIGNSHAGIEFIKNRVFWRRKVFLVLDDVDHVQQLKALAIDPRFLHPGSRVIVTTRNISPLNYLQSVLDTYKLEELNKDESLQLFSWHAFNRNNPPEDFMELSNIVVDYAWGIPLVLEVLGSFLNGKTNQSEWRSAITKLKKIPHNDVQRKLRISFDSLDIEEQKLFLDIACFFVGKSKHFTIQVLQDCKIFPEIGLRRLEELCLLKYDFNEYSPLNKNAIVIHDILKHMGREIVRQECVNYPGRRSRLWDHNDALEVLKNAKGTEAVEGLVLLWAKKKDIQVDAKAFQKMNRLRVLCLNHIILRAGYQHLSRDLVWLSWHHFSLSALPSQLYIENLVTLDLSYSNIKQVWRGTKVLSKLKFLYLSHCRNLTTTPVFFGLSNLEQLLLDQCVNLQDIDESIGYLQKLLLLDLTNCKSLRKLPRGMSKLKSLEIFLIGGQNCGSGALTKSSSGSLGLSLNFVQSLRCLKELSIEDCTLTQLPAEIGNMMSLTRLHILKSKFGSLPESICKLTGLKSLVIVHCDVPNLPSEIGRLSRLENLSLWGNKFGNLPESICKLTSLETLEIADCAVPNLPSEVGRLSRLKFLDLSGNKFSSLPGSIGDLTNLKTLELGRCDRLQSLPKLSGSGRGSVLHVDDCLALESISMISNYDEVSFYNCPKLVDNYSANKIGTSLLKYDCKENYSFTIYHSGGVFPDWLQHEITNSYFCFKVPPIGSKRFLRWIFYVVHAVGEPYAPYIINYKIHNKTKDVYYYRGKQKVQEVPCDLDDILRDQTIIHYYSCYVDETEIEKDEIQVSLTCGNLVLKKWGIHVSCYSRDDQDLINDKKIMETSNLALIPL